MEGRPLILGGVEVPHTHGLLGHSDADVLTHAIIDALLGAAGLGDIGEHFPDTDERFKGADSVALLRETVALLGADGLRGRSTSTRRSCSRRRSWLPYRDRMRRAAGRRRSASTSAT